MSELPEDIHDELQGALENQLAQWGRGDRAQHEANERLLEVLRRARAFELADGDDFPIEAGEAVTPTSVLQAALNEQAAARQSGDSERMTRANQSLVEAYRRFNGEQTSDSQ
jgi:hypothetical protein